MSKWQAVIGLEAHFQLRSLHKAFCGCVARDYFKAPPNSSTCGICLGAPGTLPVVNRDAVQLAVRAAVGLGCLRITPQLEFDRKSYVYADMPKGYQITQKRSPLGLDGTLLVEADGAVRAGAAHFAVRVEQAHFEEDSAKTKDGAVDFNRAGVPLVEVVTAPDMRSGKEAASCARELQLVLQRAHASEAKLEDGSLRLDVNVSVRLEGETELRQRVELKNMNSLRSLRMAVEYELRRQSKLHEAGEAVLPETRQWDAETGKTVSLRAKGGAEDYRYVAEPDLPTSDLEVQLDVLKAEILPRLPLVARQSLEQEHGLSKGDAALIVDADAEGSTSDFFFRAVASGGAAKVVAMWMIGECAAEIKKSPAFSCIADTNLEPGDLAELVGLVEAKSLSRRAAKDLLPDLLSTRGLLGNGPRRVEALVAERGIGAIVDADVLKSYAQQVLDAHPKELALYVSGKTNLERMFVGKAVSATNGRADAE
ncbi:Aspartyl/glutamyl-tRNA amidotransferase subunit B, partial [Pelagophyceae sp. CCMP2097]